MKVTLIPTPETFEFGNWLLELSAPNPRCEAEVIAMRSRFKDKPTPCMIRAKQAQFELKMISYVADWAPKPQRAVWRTQ